jgi:serine protease Do
MAQTAPRARNAQVIVSQGGTSYLGIGVADIDAERAKALNLREERGVEIKSVIDDSPAAKAGLKAADVVVEFNGQPVQGTEQFQRLVRETPAGREVKLTVIRGGATQTIAATIGSRKGMTMFGGRDGEWSFAVPPVPPNPPMPPEMPDMPRLEITRRYAVLGIEGESVSSQLAEFFGVQEGVLVKMVTRNSVAEKAGIKAGDVIVKVDDSKVATTREITNALRAARTKKTFPVILVRNKKEMTVTVTVEEPPAPGTRARVWIDLPTVHVSLPEIHIDVKRGGEI